MTKKSKVKLSPFCKLVKKHLYETGKTQTEFAKEVGLTAPHLSSIINGRCLPQPKTVNKISKVMNIPLADIIEILLESE